MSTIYERAKEDVDDETVFSRDQINCLWDMLYALKPLLDVEGHNPYAGNWPWQRGHPWRYRLGQKFFSIGYQLMHGKRIDD